MDIQYLSEYLDYLEVEKGLSKNTIDAYSRDLSVFMDFCALYLSCRTRTVFAA